MHSYTTEESYSKFGSLNIQNFLDVDIISRISRLRSTDIESGIRILYRQYLHIQQILETDPLIFKYNIAHIEASLVIIDMLEDLRHILQNQEIT